MRRSSKPRVVWLPPTNLNSIDNVTISSGIQAIRVDVSPANPTATGEIPVVIDGTSTDPLDPAASLSDIENNGYRLRRIVGKIWVRMDQVDDASTLFAIVTAGLIVRKAEQSTGQSYAELTGSDELIGPSQIRNYGDPWIWRRSWLVGNNLSPNKTEQSPLFPETNEFFSALDGPHVDQKTARLVSAEERLFLDVQVRSNHAGDAPPDEIPVSTLILTDLRVLASMRTSSGNRRNASR